MVEQSNTPEKSTNPEIDNSKKRTKLMEVLKVYYTKVAPENLDNLEAIVARVYGGPASSVGGMAIGGIWWTE